MVRTMVWAKRIPADEDRLDAQRPGLQSAPFQHPPEGPKGSWVRRLLTVAAWIVGFVALFALYLRISFTGGVTSDGANNVLQAWDMLHGHVLLHGWIIGDATYYTFDLPVLAVAEIFSGLSDLSSHVAAALIYLIVTSCAVVLALTDSRGLARVARGGVVIAVLTAMFYGSYAPYVLGAPDHTGTSAFLLVSFLLIDRMPARRFTSLLLLAILCAGQIGDATVLYVAVPAVVAVCGYRAAAARKVRTSDAANALAAAVSVPLAAAVRAVMLHFGGYQMVAPKVAIAAPWRWPHNADLAWHAVCLLFGVLAAGSSFASSLTRVAGYILGLVCLLAAAAGVARVAWTWRTASRAEQLLCVAIVIDLSAYVVSTMPVRSNPYEVIAVLPCGAVLAARACVPGNMAGTLRAGIATSLAVIVPLLTLTTTAARPAVAAPTVSLTAWLEAHGLTYGLAGYWNSSDVTLQSGNRVQVRAVVMQGRQFVPYDWETNTLWFDASRHDATFVIVDLAGKAGSIRSPAAEQFFGTPYKIGHVAHWAILIYQKNLLEQVAMAGERHR
jgi:hypothetical protein